MQNSVPHLKSRLQLQQAIMKEIIQRAIAEKNSSTTTSTATSPALGNSPSTSTVSATSNTTETTNTNATPPNTLTSIGQPVTAINMGTLTSSSSLATGTSKSGTVAGSNISVGGAMSNAVSIQSNFPQVFSQAALESLSLQLPKVLRDKIAKLPPEQQKFIYFRQLKQMQQLKEQQLKKQGVAEKQNQLVKEQQAQVLGIPKPGASSRTGGLSVGVGPSSDQKKKSSFANMKLISASSAPSSPAGAKKKGKAKDSGGPDAE